MLSCSALWSARHHCWKWLHFAAISAPWQKWHHDVLNQQTFHTVLALPLSELHVYVAEACDRVKGSLPLTTVGGSLLRFVLVLISRASWLK